MLNSKRAQIGESLTWIIATLIIIVVLIIFISFSATLSKTKIFKAKAKEASGDLYSNWIDSKTEIAYRIKSENKEKIADWIAEENENE